MKTLTQEIWMELPERRAIVSIHREVERLVSGAWDRIGRMTFQARKSEYRSAAECPSQFRYLHYHDSIGLDRRPSPQQRLDRFLRRPLIGLPREQTNWHSVQILGRRHDRPNCCCFYRRMLFSLERNPRAKRRSKEDAGEKLGAGSSVGLTSL